MTMTLDMPIMMPILVREDLILFLARARIAVMITFLKFIYPLPHKIIKTGLLDVKQESISIP